ncbi:unnamed protein product [marine sediment metagenome]|uniref:Uncharacterized protein n=1 Tax=marine sediment metagenome TaxID=412755 RepID=X1RVN6_9ZZZZ
MKKQKNYDKRVKNTRILLSDYLLLKEFAQRAGVSMSEALHKIITGLAPKAEPEPVASKSPAQIPKIPVFFKPKSIERNGAFAFKPKSISGNGITQFKLKSIR